MERRCATGGNVMPKRPNTKPTHIYWLVDMRPEIIAAGWGKGQPFYCGKTIHPAKRLRQHKAGSKNPHGTVWKRVSICGDDIQMRTMEIVHPEGDWAARERHWIAMLRCAFPDVQNIAAGGEGAPGWIPSEDARRRIGAAQRGKIMSEETRAKLRTARARQIITDETREKISQRFKGQTRPEISASMLGRQVSKETREKIRASLTGRKHTDERRSNIRAAVKGKKRPPRSPEHCANIAASKRAWWAAKKAAAND